MINKMKKFLMIVMMLLSFCITIHAQIQSYEMRLWIGNKYISYPIEKIDSITFVSQMTDEDDNKPDDLVSNIYYGPKTTTNRIRYDFAELYQANSDSVVFNNMETKLRYAFELNEKEFYHGSCLLIEGNYDVTFLLPSVPTNEPYEIRIGFTTSDENGICQTYFGTNPNSLQAVGLPFDFRTSANNSQLTGWFADTQDFNYNDEQELRMRNNGFMKAPAVPYVNGSQTQDEAILHVLRPNPKCLRRIIIRQQLNANAKYYLRFKAVLTGNRPIPLDYIEFCPQSTYDNQEIPEDKY